MNYFLRFFCESGKSKGAYYKQHGMTSANHYPDLIGTSRQLSKFRAKSGFFLPLCSKMATLFILPSKT